MRRFFRWLSIIGMLACCTALDGWGANVLTVISCISGVVAFMTTILAIPASVAIKMGGAEGLDEIIELSRTESNIIRLITGFIWLFLIVDGMVLFGGLGLSAIIFGAMASQLMSNAAKERKEELADDSAT